MIAFTRGELACEWQHLLRTLAVRSPAAPQRWQADTPQPHPLFTLEEGPRDSWERMPE